MKPTQKEDGNMTLFSCVLIPPYHPFISPSVYPLSINNLYSSLLKRIISCWDKFEPWTLWSTVRWTLDLYFPCCRQIDHQVDQVATNVAFPGHKRNLVSRLCWKDKGRKRCEEENQRYKMNERFQNEKTNRKIV